MSSSEVARPILEQGSAASRWWVYQRERFPILVQGSLIAVLSFSAKLHNATAVPAFAVLRLIARWPAQPRSLFKSAFGAPNL